MASLVEPGRRRDCLPRGARSGSAIALVLRVGAPQDVAGREQPLGKLTARPLGFLDWLAYNEAHARLLMGDRAAAVRLLGDYLSFAPGDSAYLGRDWWFESLRGDTTFQRLTGLDR